MTVWRTYMIPLLAAAFINFLGVFTFTDSYLYDGFWTVVAFFALITFIHSLFIELGSHSKPETFFSLFLLGKFLKFLATLTFIVFFDELSSADFYDFGITVALLYLITMFVDIVFCIRFGQKIGISF